MPQNTPTISEEMIAELQLTGDDIWRLYASYNESARRRITEIRRDDSIEQIEKCLQKAKIEKARADKIISVIHKYLRKP